MAKAAFAKAAVAKAALAKAAFAKAAVAKAAFAKAAFAKAGVPKAAVAKAAFAKARAVVARAVQLERNCLASYKKEQAGRMNTQDQMQDARLTHHHEQDPMWNDSEHVAHVVALDGTALQRASERLRDVEEIVLKAVEQNSMALHFASTRLRDVEEIVLKAVEQNSMALHFASTRLRNVNEVVLKAVEQNGMALRFGSPRLRDLEEVVLKAVEQNGMALRFASPRLQDIEEVVLKAVEQNDNALRSASERLLYDRDLLLEFCRFKKIHSLLDARSYFRSLRVRLPAKVLYEVGSALSSRVSSIRTQSSYMVNIIGILALDADILVNATEHKWRLPRRTTLEELANKVLEKRRELPRNMYIYIKYKLRPGYGWAVLGHVWDRNELLVELVARLESDAGAGAVVARNPSTQRAARSRSRSRRHREWW